MAPEIYTVLLRSDNGVGDDTISLKYTINWESFLPTKHKRFILKAYFRCTEDAGNDQDYVGVSISPLNCFVYDSKNNGKGTTVGVFSQLTGNTTQSTSHLPTI